MPNHSFTKKDILLMALLREVPYLTSDLVWMFFYPSQKNRTYAKEKLSFLKKLQFVECSRKSDNKCIWYLTQKGHDDFSKYSFLIKKIPQVKDGIIVNTNPTLEYQPFYYRNLTRFPEYHTMAMNEFYYLVSRSRCFYNKIILDFCTNKKAQLDINYNGDLLLCNGLETTEGRVFVELENSIIREQRLAAKINSITSMQGDYYLFICTDKDIFLNMGRLIRKIFVGDARNNGKLITFEPSARAALLKKLLIGYWLPSMKNDGIISKLSGVSLFRYDHEIFNKKAWQNKFVNGVVQKDENGSPIRVMERVPFAGKKSGQSEFQLADIFKQYRPKCAELEKSFLG